MPSLKETVLILLKEGLLFYFSDPCRYFKIGKQYNPESFRRTINRLEKEGLLTKSRKAEKNHILLTKQGKKFLREHQKAPQHSQRSWDEKWRLVIFDIPESKRKLRNYLRQYLITFGFAKVQRSIWISPHDHREAISRYAEKLGLSDYIFQITADSFHGLSTEALAQTFWNLTEIHNQYLKLIKKYQKKQKELCELGEKTPKDRAILREIVKEHLLWDYQSIRSHDPELPPEFLPDDWGGEKARKFIAAFPGNKKGQWSYAGSAN